MIIIKLLNMDFIDELINSKYRIISKIGEGNFGTIYKGSIEKKKTQIDIAIKTESVENISIKHETRIINYLYSKGVNKIPYIYWYGIFKEHRCLVIKYYETPLIQFIESKDASKKNKIINRIFIKMIEILESIHTEFVIHRDLKPENFMISNNELYLIDFGLSTFYIDENEKHIPMKEECNIIGTPRYTSINIHNGNTAARRDDMISIGYIYMLLIYDGVAKWEDSVSIISDTNDNNTDIINIAHPIQVWRKQCKEWMNIAESHPLYKYMKYCYNMDFEKTPNYKGVKLLEWNL